MRRTGIYQAPTCFSPNPGVRFDDRTKLVLHLTKTVCDLNLKDGEKVTVSLKEENGSAIWDLERYTNESGN